MFESYASDLVYCRKEGRKLYHLMDERNFSHKISHQVIHVTESWSTIQSDLDHVLDGVPDLMVSAEFFFFLVTLNLF